MEAKGSRGGEPQLRPHTSMDESATPPTASSVAKASTASVNTATSPLQSSDGEDDNRAPNSAALSPDSASPSSSIASSSFSMFSQSTTTRRGEEGKREECAERGSAASLAPSLTKRSRVLSSSPAATRKNSPGEFAVPLASPAPTQPEGALPLLSTAALAEVVAVPASAADPLGSTINTDVPMHGDPLSPSPTAPQSSAPSLVAPEEVPTPSVGDAAEEGSAPPAAPGTLPASAAAAVDERVVDAGGAKCVTEGDESEGSGASASHSLHCDNGAPMDGRAETSPNVEQPSALSGECLPATWTEPPPPPSHASADAGVRRSEEHSNAPSGSPHAPPSASASFLRESPEEPPSLLRIAPEEQLRHSGGLSGTIDSNSDKIEGAATCGDAGGGWGSQRRPHHSSAHRNGAIAERDETQNDGSVSGDSDAREGSERCGRLRGSGHRRRTRELDTEASHTSPLHASGSQSHQEGFPAWGPFPSPTAALDAGLTSMAGAAANDVPQPRAAPQHPSCSFSASTHAHTPNVKASTAAPSLTAADALASIHTMGISSTQARLLPTERRRSSRELLSSGRPDMVFQTAEDESDEVAAPEGKGFQSSTRARQQQGQEERACTEDDVVGKATVVAITAEEAPAPPSLPPATHVREAAAVAVAPLLLHPKERQGDKRAEALASASAPPLRPTPVVAMTRGAMSLDGGASATGAPALSTAVLPAPAHPSPLGSSPSALAVSSPPAQSTTHHQPPPPPPPPSSSAVATLAPSSATAKEAAAARGGHDADRAVATSTSAASVELDAVPTALHSVSIFPALPVPVAAATAAAGSIGEPHRDAHLASLLCVNRPISLDRAVGGSGSVETAGSCTTLKSAVTGQNLPSLGGVRGSAVLGQTPLSMAQFADRCTWSEDGSRHGSDADNRSASSTGEEREGTESWQLHAAANYRHGYDSSGSFYSYSYGSSFSTGSITGSTIRGFRSSVIVSAPRLHDEGEGAVTGDTAEASGTEVVKLVEYEEVTPVVRGKGGLLGWLCCGRKRATEGVRTSRMEVHRVRCTAECTPREHSIGRSALHAGWHKDLPRREGSAASPVATAGAVRANIATRSADKAVRQAGLGGMRSGGAAGSEGSGPPQGLGSATGTPHSSETGTAESGNKGMGEAAAYAGCRGSTSSYADGEAPLISRADTLAPSHDGAEEMREEDSDVRSQGEGAESAAAAAEQNRTSPLDVVGQAAFGSSASTSFARLDVSVSVNTKASSSADWWPEVDGANYSSGMGVLGSDGGVPEGDGSAPSAAADAAEAPDHYNRAVGCTGGGGGVEEREEGAVTTASTAPHPLWTLLASTAELPRLRAWDAEPPVAASPGLLHQEREAKRLEVKYNEEAVTAAEEAQQAFRQAVQELMVHPPRQCFFVSVHGLRHWCSALHCPQQAPRAAFANGAAAMLAGGWPDAWGGNAQAGAPIMEDPKWMAVRLAIYVHDSAGERLVAAGSVFSLPSNLEALRRCLGCGGGGIVEHPSTGGYGRDSWSDLLVFQLPESASEGVAEGMQEAEVRDHDSIVSITAEGTTGHCSDRGDGGGDAPSHRASGCGLTDSSHLGSLGACRILYVKLEERGERWVSLGDACVCAAATRPSEAASCGTRADSSVADAQPATSAATTGTIGGGAGGLVTSSQQDEEDTPPSSVGRPAGPLSPSSSLPLAGEAALPSFSAREAEAGCDGTRHAIGATAETDSVHVRASDDGGGDECAPATGTRLEECWRPLAVSPPLLPADLCQLQSNQPPLLTALGTTAEAAASAVACPGQPLPQLSCRLRWAQEPRPRSTAAPEPVPQVPSAEQGLSAWASLGTAITEYERVCRCAFTGAVSALTAESHTPSRPLTVLWNTIPSHLAAENEKPQEVRTASVATAPLQRWCGGELAPRGHAMEALIVCSVVVRGAAAILFAHELADTPESRYCPPTSISVTGGCDGVVVEGAAAVGADGAHGTPVAHRAPVMQYNISFHAVLTRDTASSLLFTVHGAASPADVFGFAVWTPFDAASAAHVQSRHRHGEDAGVGGVADVWLPLFAPASADAAPPATTPAQQRKASSSGISSATLSSTNKGQKRSATGLLLVGWLHCDIEAVFLPSLAEAAVQQLWNGPQHSLSSLAAEAGGESGHGGCCMGHGISVDDDTLVDFSVMEGVGLRPLATELGMPLSPTPLRWDDSATWGNNGTCAHVYCEVLALQQQRQQGTSHQVPGWVPHAADVFALASSSSTAGAAMHRPHSSGYRLRAAARNDFPAMSFSSESDGQGRVARRAPLSDSGEGAEARSAYDTRTWTVVTGAEPNAVLPVTDSVAHTNYPRWRHTFRCGLALLSSLHLRVFDLCQYRLGGDGREATPQDAERGSARGRLGGVSEGRAMLLGTTTVSSWLLRRLLCRSSGEGCAWLPLLWTPGAAARPVTASATANGKASFQKHFFPAVCNGFVLVEWRRVPQATAVARLPCSGEASSWCASVTRRLLSSKGRHTTASAARTRSFLGTLRKLHDYPQLWYHPMPSPGTEPNSVTAVPTAYSRQLGWITPEVVPWLRVHEVRLQWPWLQHLLCMHGGQAQLSLRYPTAQGEMRLLAQCLLVPLRELVGPSTSTVCGGRPSRVHSRQTRDATALYGLVLSGAPSDDAAPPPSAAAPAEATLCLPASPLIEVQVWWYPRSGTGSAAGGGLVAPFRFIGRGEWRFPVHEEAAGMRGLVAGTGQGGFEEALNAHLTTAGEAGLACLSDGEEEGGAAMGLAPLPTALRSFFTPHEADLRVAPVHSTGLPQHLEGGVLTWRLMSVPRLLCDDWGKVPPAMPRPLPGSSSCVEGPCGDVRRPLRPSPAAVPASTWVWPDVGTPAVVHVEVCDMICFDHTDGPCIDAVHATATVQIAVSGTTCVGSPTETPSDESAAITAARCWMCPGDAPPPDASRVAYALSPVHNRAANAAGTWNDMGGYQQQYQLPTSQASWAVKTPLQPPQATAAAGGGEKGAARRAVPGVGASGHPTVEVQWPPRRFGWVDDAPPSLSVWVMTPPSLSRGAGAAGDTAAAATEVKERVWGAVRLPGLDAFTSTSGVLWLPLFQSYTASPLAAEVPRCTATEDMALSSISSGSGTGEHCGALSLSPPPSTVEWVHGGIAATAPPQSTRLPGDALDSLVMMAAPRAAIVVKHVGFVAVRYAHNMQRRAADAATTRGTEPSAAGPRALLVRVGSLHRRFPVRAAARHTLSPLSSPPPSESCTPVSEAPLTPPSDAASTHRSSAWTALAAVDNAADTAAATGVLLDNASGDADVLLGFEAHQLWVRAPDADIGRDDSREASGSSRVAVFPLPRRDTGDGGSLQLRVQARVAASGVMATSTMYFDPGGDEATPEGAQWVPLVVRRRLHDEHGVGYDGEGESVVAELLVQWRVVDLSVVTAPPRSTFSPMSLQRLVREFCGGGDASCTYTVLPALSAATQIHRNSLRQSCAGAQQHAGFLRLPGSERRVQDTVTAEQASRVLSRVLCTTQPRHRRCVYWTLDQLFVQCSARQRRMWAALQRGTTASPQEVLVDGENDDAASAPIRFRLEVQLRWPAEWSAAWRGIASSSPRRVPLEAEMGAAASLSPAAAASATPTAGTVPLNVWIDSGEGVFAESSSPAAPGAAGADGAAAYASEERLLSCAALPPLCLVLPSAQDIDRVLGDLGLAARFSLTFALFLVPQWRGDKDSPEKRTSDVCVGTGRTPMAASPSVQFGLTSLLPSVSRRSGGGPPCADAAGADAKGGVETVPPLLRWRARVTESLPVSPPASSVLCTSPKVRDLTVDSGKAMGDDVARCGEQMPSWSLSSSLVSSSAAKEEVIEGDGRTQTTGAAAAPLLPRTPALAHVAVTRIELCGVDVSLARGAVQRHLRALPPATVTVMTADVTDAAAAPTDRRGGAGTEASAVHQLLPCLLPLRPTAASPPIHASSTPPLPMARLDETQPFPPPLERYMWSVDVCIAAPVSQLVFYVSVPVAALRSTRVEEAWLQPRSPSSEAEQQDADSQSVDARWRLWHGDQVNVVGKAAYALNLLDQVKGARRTCDDSRLISAAQTANCTRDVVLEVESLVHGRWLGRLWLQVDITAADLLMRDAASVFFTSRMTLSVQRCSGFAVGDVPLTYRAEETYVRLRERAALLCERRGRLPRRLRQQLKEIRQIRHQLRQGQSQQRDGVLANHVTPSTAGVVRLTSAWGEPGAGPSSTHTSNPFALPTAAELVRQRSRATTSSSSTCAPLLCVSRDTNTAHITNSATATVHLELCQASNGVTVAAGQVVLPLRSARTLWHDGAWHPPVSTVTSPLLMRVDLQPCTVSEMPTPHIRPVTPSGGEADVTATWVAHPARGDTWLTCICLKLTAGGDGAATPPRQLFLRWVYCFEATAYPETEHAVDMPLRLRSSSTANGHGGKSAQTPHACHRLGYSAPVYWSGAAMQLPRIGPVGATIRRVELLEVTPLSCAHLLVGGEAWGVAQPSPLRSKLPTRDACMTTRLAVHVWTVADELCFETGHRQAQDSGEDALMWLTCGGASAGGSGRCSPGYEVLLGLYTSSSLARCAAQLLQQRRLQATGAGMPIAPLALAKQPPRLPPHAGVNAPVACNASGPLKVDGSSSSPPTPHVRSHASTSSAKGVVVPGAVGSGGGVAMRALTFRCGGAALATLELGQVDTISCCVVAARGRRDRGAALRVHQLPGPENSSGAVDRPEASIVVLDAGRATSLLQERCSTEDLPQAAPGSSPLASAQLTATWLPTLELSRSTMVAPCATAAPPGADAHHSAQKARLQEVRGALLRVVLPLAQPDPVVAAAGDGKADDDAGSGSDDGVAAIKEEEFRIEVSVRGRRCGAGVDETATTAYYVSDPLCASDIFRSARSYGERSGIGSSADTTAAAAGGESPLSMSPSQWLSTLVMRLVQAPASAGTTGSATCERSEKGREAGPLSPRMAPTATMEVTWSLDVLGVLRTSACAAGVVLASAKCARRRADRDAGDGAHRAKAVFGSLARMADHTDEDDDASGGGMGMRQLEAYATWTDFFAAQDGVEKMRAAQAELRHWRCTIVGVEVAGVELPSWCSTGVETDADTEDEVYDIAQCTSLLAQLVLPMGAPSSAAGAHAEGQPTQDSDGTGHHYRRRVRSKGGLVMGVARATVTRMDRGARLDTETAPTSCYPATVKGGACSARSVAPVSSRSGPRRHRYTGTFTPLSWSMAVSDMIGQAAAAAAVHREGKGAAPTVGGAPAAGLTVWQLLGRAPASSFSARNSIDNNHSTAENTTQLVYNLGTTQLAGLLHECALYLVQVLGRWLSDVYTTEERDALLGAAALYPTQWMPLAPVTPIMGGTHGDARVRFKCAYSYHGPALLLPRSLSMVAPSCITAPRVLADAVCCAQLDHVQLAYTSLDGTEATATMTGPHCRNSASAAAAWLSRLSLVMRVRVTTERAVDGAVIHSRNVAQWHTRLASAPCGGAPLIAEAAWVGGTVAPFAPTASSSSSAAPQPTPAPTAPVAAPVPVTVLPSAGRAAESPQDRGDEARQRIATAASAAPPSVTEVVPLLPTSSFFCWHPPSLEEAMEGYSVAQTSAAAPAAHATETTTTTLVEIVLVLADEKTEEGDDAVANSQGRLPGSGGGVVAGTVVGRGQLRLGSSSSKEVVWDAAEGRVESGWRLYAPLSVRLPVSAEAALPRSGCDAPTRAVAAGEGVQGEPHPLLAFSFDLLIFTAPSMAQVAALQASRAAQAEQRRRSLSVLQRTEEVLATLATADYLLHEQGNELNKGACSIAAGEPRMTLRQFSQMWVSRKPYQLLRVPPIVIRVDTFAVLDGVPSSSARRVAALSGGGNNKGGPTRLSQTLWTTLRRRVVRRASTHDVTDAVPCPSQRCSGGGFSSGTSDAAVSVEVQVWLVDEQTGEVRVPVWTLLSNGPPLLRSGGGATCNLSHVPSLASHLHAGRAILQNVQRLRLDWCSEDEGARSQSMSLLASLAGLLGSASVSYMATNGSACTWVSGGLRRRCAQHTRHGTCHASKVQGSAGGGNSDRGAVEPAPPLLRSAAHHTSPGRRCRQPLVPPRAAGVAAQPSPPPPPPGLDSCTASCQLDYALYGSHFLSCAAAAQDGQGTRPGWRCEAHASVTGSFSAASPSMNAGSRLFHSATLVGRRIWLLGGWMSPPGATTLPSTLAALVGTARLVERRRREVRQAVTHGSDNDATGDRLSPAPLMECSSRRASTSAPSARCKAGDAPSSASLRWCEVVQSVQCLNDGFPAPPVDTPSPSSQAEDSRDAAGATRRRLAAPPRLACHVAVTCGDRYVAVFGGLMAPTGTDDDEPVATSAVHVYDTVQGTWSAQYEPNTGDVQGEWPVARYGHCVAPVPGTGGARQPRSYFVFGGATTTPSCRTVLVPPAQLLWMWTPMQGVRLQHGSSGAVEDVSMHSAWRRVQLPVELITPLVGRFLSQLHAYSAVEVAAAVCGDEEPLDDGAAVPPEPGFASIILCVAGGMTAPALHKVPATSHDQWPFATEASAADAYRAFCERVEPWFAHPASDVASVLVACVCERQQQLPSLPAYSAPPSQVRTRTH